jgi:hypothetical protein
MTITDYLKEQLSILLGDLSVFYSSSKVLNSIKSQIDNLKKSNINQELINKYQQDYELLVKENKELDDTINDIINNSSKISSAINTISDFSLSVDYIKNVSNEYDVLEKYSTIVPKTITKLNNHIENLETLQLAIINQTGQYSLKNTGYTVLQKIIIATAVCVALLGVYKSVKL